MANELVVRIRASLLREAAIGERLDGIRRNQESLKEEQDKLLEEYRVVVAQRKKDMESMDVLRPGNAGYEARVTRFLMELVKQGAEQ